MKSLKFKKIDAFTTGHSSGNPAGAIYLDDNDNLSDEEMLKIAGELKTYVNEVGFLKKGDNADFKLRYFSSEKEVEFCGHATIAIMYELISNSEELSSKSEITIETNMGISKVLNKIKTENAIYISAPEPQFNPHKPDINIVANALNIPSKEIDHSLPIRIVNGGLWTLIVPVKSANTVINLKPEFERLKLLCEEMVADVIIVASEDTVDKKNRFRTRVFPPPFGYLEDPATGSANSALGYYMFENGRWNGESASIEQNNLPDLYNTIKIVKPDDRLLFGGAAVTRIEGTYQLH